MRSASISQNTVSASVAQWRCPWEYPRSCSGASVVQQHRQVLWSSSGAPLHLSSPVQMKGSHLTKGECKQSHYDSHKWKGRAVQRRGRGGEDEKKVFRCSSLNTGKRLQIVGGYFYVMWVHLYSVIIGAVQQQDTRMAYDQRSTTMHIYNLRSNELKGHELVPLSASPATWRGDEEVDNPRRCVIFIGDIIKI